MPKLSGLYGCFLIVLCGLFSSPTVFSAERYIVDGEQSFVRIAAKMCEPDLLKGEFGNVSGEIFLDEENLENSSVNITVTAVSAVFDHEYHRSDHIETIVMGAKLLNSTLSDYTMT